MFSYVIISDLNTFKSNTLLNMRAAVIFSRFARYFLDRMAFTI